MAWQTVNSLLGGGVLGARTLGGERVLVPAEGATVYVYLRGTTSPVPVYSDEGVTLAAQPLSTDADGRVLTGTGTEAFVSQPGELDVRISADTIVIPRVVPVGTTLDVVGGAAHVGWPI